MGQCRATYADRTFTECSRAIRFVSPVGKHEVGCHAERAGLAHRAAHAIHVERERTRAAPSPRRRRKFSLSTWRRRPLEDVMEAASLLEGRGPVLLARWIIVASAPRTWPSATCCQPAGWPHSALVGPAERSWSPRGCRPRQRQAPNGNAAHDPAAHGLSRLHRRVSPPCAFSRKPPRCRAQAEKGTLPSDSPGPA